MGELQQDGGDELGWLVDLCQEHPPPGACKKATARAADRLREFRARVAELEARLEGYRAAFYLLSQESAFIVWQDGEPVETRDHNSQFWSAYPVVLEGRPRLLVMCSDTFAYACADWEEATFAEAPELAAVHRTEGWPGLVRWVQKKRPDEKVIAPVVKAMENEDTAREKLAKVRELAFRWSLHSDPYSRDHSMAIERILDGDDS